MAGQLLAGIIPDAHDHAQSGAHENPSDLGDGEAGDRQDVADLRRVTESGAESRNE